MEIMERQPGAYVLKEDGRLEPDAADEAMAKRHGLGPGKPDRKKQPKEVTEDAAGK